MGFITFQTAFRQIRRHKSKTFINVLGLSLGFAAFMLISAYVNFEKSYDSQQPDADQIYRVESRFYKGDDLNNDWPTSTNGLAKAMKEHYPEVQSFARISWANSERVLRYGNIKFREERVCFADSNFLTFFSYPMVKGNPHTALSGSNHMVISESAARKYFGPDEAVGKMLQISTLSQTFDCMVTGVFKDLPDNSTMKFNFLISWATSPLWVRDFWYQHESYTFVRLPADVNTAAIEAKFPQLAEQYKSGDALKDLKWGIHLVPLREMHLNPVKQYEIETKGNRRVVNLLQILAYVILGVAFINYINLTTARAVERAREVGVRKVTGATNAQLFAQFLSEACLVNLIALVLAILLTALIAFCVPYLATGGLNPGMLFDGGFFTKTVFVFILCILVSGAYPSFILTSFEPVSILKGRYSFSPSGARIRQGLVAFQFAGSLILIAWTLAVYKQVSYMKNEDTGVNINQTLVVKAPVNSENYAQKVQRLKQELIRLTDVSGVTGSGSVPGKEVAMFISNRKFGDPKSAERMYEMLKVDFEFIEAYNLELVSGRSFDKARPADSTGLVLNESAVEQFGFNSAEEAIGKQVWLETAAEPNTVIGVVKNYHQQSLQQAFTPVILFMDPAFDWIPTTYYSIKLNNSASTHSVASLEKVWNTLFPESSFDFFFLDEFYNRQYLHEVFLGNVFLSFAVLTVFIACLGLFSLTAYAASRRTREIGVRKVLGASVGRIITLLTLDSVKLIVLSSIIAIPVSVLLILHWLESYAFRIELSWWLPAVPVVILFAIAALTVGFLTFRAANANPAKSLRVDS